MIVNVDPVWITGHGHITFYQCGRTATVLVGEGMPRKRKVLPYVLPDPSWS